MRDSSYVGEFYHRIPERNMEFCARWMQCRECRKRGVRTHARRIPTHRDARRTPADSEVLRQAWPVSEMHRVMWGRLSTCGRLSIGLGGICILVGRRVDNPPQVGNLPHIKPRARLNQYRCPVVGELNERPERQSDHRSRQSSGISKYTNCLPLPASASPLTYSVDPGCNPVLK